MKKTVRKPKATIVNKKQKKPVKRNEFLSLRKLASPPIGRETPYPLKNLDNNVLAGVLHQQKKSKTIVIGIHGFLSNKNQLLLRQLCVELSRSGVDAYRVDLSGNGDSEGRFEDATPKKLMRDIIAIVEHFKKQYANVVLLGHSFGASLVLIAAARMNVKGVIAINAPVRLEHFEQRLTSKQQEQLKSVGFTMLMVQRAIAEVPFTLTDRFVQETKELNVIAAASQIHCPALIIYGSADKSVSEEERDELVKELFTKEIFLVGGADHNLTKPDQIDMVIGRVIGWVKDL